MSQTIDAATYQSRQREKDFQRTVVDLARMLGWDVFHFPRMTGNPAGWPDLLMVRDGVWILAELKTAGGRLGPKQREMIARLGQQRVFVRIWRPSDWERIEWTLREGA